MWPYFSQGGRRESYDRWSHTQALDLSAGAGWAPKYLGELIILCLIGWKGKWVQMPEMCINIEIQELEGAWFGA